jgi:hypothetical protein
VAHRQVKIKELPVSEKRVKKIDPITNNEKFSEL